MRLFIQLVIAIAAIAPVSAEQRSDTILIQGNPAGSQRVQTDQAGVTQVEYSYNDRGRGDHVIATWKLDAVGGVPTAYESDGNDYMKAPVEERFEIKDGTASWKNRSEQGKQAIAGEAFYVPANPPPEFFGVLARALLKAPGHKLPLLPAGEASIEESGKLNVGKIELTQYRITGLGFTPQAIWLDHDGNTAATVSSWFSVIQAPYQNAIPQLQEAQQAADDVWSGRIAHALAHVPKGDLVIRNARLFDPRDLSVTTGMSVLIRGDRIVRVAPDAEMKASADAEVIDAHDRFLMPGLWDCHQHFSDIDGPLDLATGVTSARDMANDTDTFLKRVARFDNGTELGPRVLKAGIIDGTGEFAGPTKMRVDTAEQAHEFTPEKPEVREFIAFLKQHHTVLDPTMGAFEGLFCGDPTVITPGLGDVAQRFPPQVRRQLLSGALEVPKGQEIAYREAFPGMLRLLKALHDAGVTIIPGTDGLAGYMLHHELELYVRAGISSAEVLRMATLTPALVMGVNKDRGVIAAGKLADMVIIDGDPSRNIRDINKITTVIKGGKVYDPGAIEKALGIVPRQAAR